MESEQPERRFSVRNGPRTYQLKSEIVHCKQKGDPVALYFRRLNKLWLELSQLDPVEPCTKVGAEIELRREEERLHQFLMGLDHDSFVAVGSTVLNSQPLPSVHSAYSMVVREEQERDKRRTLAESKPVPSHVVAQDSTRIKSIKRRKASIPSMIVELPEEIVTEILVRLPPDSLFRFGCVSKRWKSITLDPRFVRDYLKLGSNTRGMLYPYMEYKRHGPGMGYSGWSSRELFVPDYYRHRLLFYFRTTMRQNNRRILASSNGLVLSQVHPLNGGEPDGIYNGISFCVSNPLTKQNVILSKISVPSIFGSDPTMWPWTCGFATRATIDTSGSYNVSYRVVVVLPPADNALKVEHHSSIVIFSSDSGSWKRVPGPISNIPAAVLERGYRAQDFCYEGVLHWLDQGGGRRTIVTYNPYEECPNSFSHIRMPQDTSGERQIIPSSLMSLVRSGHEEEDFPRCCEIEHCPGDSGLSLVVWRMEDYEKRLWCLEQRCAISPHCLPLLKGCRQLFAPGPQSPPGVFRHLFVNLKPYRVVAIDLGSRKEEDVAIGKIVSGSIHLYTPRCLTLPLVPFASCPWSSPKYYNCINRPKMQSPLPQLPLE